MPKKLSFLKRNKHVIIYYIVSIILFLVLIKSCNDWSCLGSILLYAIFVVIWALVGTILSIKNKNWFALIGFALPLLYFGLRVIPQFF